ncbi:MAG: DUF4340 domain-containing protein [Desulfobacteraceae bacterium]|nr:MAG: DUF4340 domain-containing protein [Desulfobacteraceae bacterium]
MKSKKEFILLGLVIIALAAYLTVRKTDRTNYELPVLSPIGDNEITSLKITKGKDSLELKKTDDRWLIQPEKFPADTGKVDAMLKIIRNLTVTALVSESPSDNRYDLNPENGISVVAAKGDSTLRSFDIGKSAPSGRHTFVKLADDTKVYHAGENFRNSFDQTRDQLRDKVVLTVDRNNVQQVDIKDKDNKTLLSLKQEPAAPAVAPEKNPDAKEPEAPEQPDIPAQPAKMEWKDAGGLPVNESDINNLFNNLSQLQCQSFIEGKTKADFTKPIYTVTLTGAKTVSLSIFEKLNNDDETYPAVSSENDYPFMMPAYKVDTMIQKNDAETPPMPKLIQKPKPKP